MRVSSSTIFESNIAALGQQQARLLQTQQQIASGRRMESAADDPVAAARALDISQADALNTQFAANRDTARHTLSLSESALQSVTSLLQDVRTSVVAAGNGSLNSNDRSTVAAELNGRLQELLGLANSTDGVGNYLFAGFQSRTQPFMGTPAGVGYFGDDGQRNIQVSTSRQMASSDSGADVFMRVKNGNGTFVSQAAPANTGSGIISQGSVPNPALWSGGNYTVEFNTLVTQAAVGNTGTGAISTAAVITPGLVTGNNYSVTIDPSGTTFSVVNLTTSTPVAGMTAQPYVSGAAIAFDGIQFNIQGAPVAGDVFTVSPPVSGSYTITDNATGLPVPGKMAQSYISGQAISFNGVQFDIQGSPNTGDKFTISSSTNESVFKTISDLITALNAPVVGPSLTNSLSRGLNNLDNALSSVLTTRSTLGLRLNEIDALQVSGDDLSLQLKKTLSSLQDVDYNKAISDLTQQQMTLQAAQQSFVKVTNLSLFNYL